MIIDEDLFFLHQAMVIAQQGEGMVNPNPLVGALIVKDDDIVASGYHPRYRELHAERMAFKEVDEKGINCSGATMYVTLEPCCHHGHQPPCTEAIIDHHIKRVVVGLKDPNVLVSGKGIEQLRKAGIEVDSIEEALETDNISFRESALELLSHLKTQNRVFLKFITTGMPWVTLKWAMTLDGKIATSTGDSKWISNEKSRQRVHLTRRNNMAIMTGIGTVLADDPMLNVRLSDDVLSNLGIHSHEVRQPYRIILDSRLRIPLESQLVNTASEQPLMVIYSAGVDEEKVEALSELGVTLWECDDLKEIMLRLGSEKIDSILVESGGTLSESLLKAGLVDEVMAFVAPKIIGGRSAKTPVEGDGYELMSEAILLKNRTIETIGDDILITGLISCSQE